MYLNKDFDDFDRELRELVQQIKELSATNKEYSKALNKLLRLMILQLDNKTSDSHSTSKKDSRSNSRKRGVRATEKGITKMRAAKAAGLGDDKRLTNEGLAEEANVSTKTVQRFLQGKGVDKDYAIAILTALNLEPQDIL